MVDVAAGDWLLLMEQVSRAVTTQDTNALKSLVSASFLGDIFFVLCMYVYRIVLLGNTIAVMWDIGITFPEGSQL